MLRNSVAIMVSTVITSLFGYVFWLLVARISGTEVSGTGAAITSGLQATVLLASVGAAAAMIEWLPRSTSVVEWRSRVTSGLLVSVVTGAIGAVLVVAVLGFGFEVIPELGTALGAVLFLLATVFFAAGTVLDYVAISERRGGLLLLRNVILSGLRIPLFLIPVGALSGSDHILAAWTIAAGASLVVAAFGFHRARNGHTLRLVFTGTVAGVRQMLRSLVGQHLITVAAMLAGYLLPILVVARLSATDNAYFYVTWMLGSVFFIVSPAVSTALFAEGAANPGAARALINKALLISGGLLAVPMLVYVFGSGLLLSLFGSEYDDRGRLLLLLLTLSAIPDAVTNIAVAVLRATGRMRLALRLNAGMLVLCLISSWLLLPVVGIVAVGYCWLGSQLLGALWVVVARGRISSVPLPAGHEMDSLDSLVVEGVTR